MPNHEEALNALMRDPALIKAAQERIFAEQQQRFDEDHFDSSQEKEWLRMLREQVDGDKAAELSSLHAKIQRRNDRLESARREAESAAEDHAAALAAAQRDHQEQVSADRHVCSGSLLLSFHSSCFALSAHRCRACSARRPSSPPPPRKSTPLSSPLSSRQSSR